MSDITTKLRSGIHDLIRLEAAREIDRLRTDASAKDAEIASLREANRYLVRISNEAIQDASNYCEAQKGIARLREALESASAFNVGQNVIVKKCWQRDGSCLWAVQRFDEVLANDGMGWNYELQPSDRDEAFMARYRFATMELAMTAARAALATVEGVGNG
jgi:hypothetical protein